jgi:hypothetical protein
MVDDSPEDTTPSPDSGRPGRAPPTIDLEASEVSGETNTASAGERPRRSLPRLSAAISSAIIAAIAGAGAAALVIAAAWFLGWPAGTAAIAPAAAQVDTAAIDALASRLSDLESRTASSTAAAPDPAAGARADALEKSVASLRSEVAGLRAQSDKLAAAVNDVKSTPRETSPPPDLSAINERLAQIERATRDQNAALEQEGAKPADDVPLRRLVVAALLDGAVRQGDPYAAALAAAKSLADDPDALKPLDGFAATGVPKANAVDRELLALVPKLSPPAPESSTTGSGIVERLQAGAARLVRVERTDTVGNDRSAVVARVTAAALRNDLVEARRELQTLAPADRAAAQAWLDKADARDAALAASRKFADDAMAALAKPAQ